METDEPNVCECVCWLSYTVKPFEVTGQVCVKSLVEDAVHCQSLSPPALSAFLLYHHGVIAIIAFLRSSRGRGPTASAAAAEERQSGAGGLSRRRSRGGRGGEVGGGRGERRHSGPDLAVRSQLATLVLWLSGDTQPLYFRIDGLFKFCTHLFNTTKTGIQTTK